MQETFDFYTLIIIITFLGTLLFLAFFINKKKDFFKSKINKNRSIDIDDIYDLKLVKMLMKKNKKLFY